MPAPYPEFLPEAFAIGASPTYRNTIPAAPVTAQRASFDLGFPPQVFQPVIAGGKAMLGPDMNGVLYMLSTHAVYQQSGRLYLFDAAVATAIGGYAVGTLLSSTDGLTVWCNLTAANSADPDAGGAGWVALFSYGIASISALIGGVRTLSLAESSKKVVVLSGALVGNQQIVLPTTFQQWLIVNTCTGAFAVTVKTAAGAGVIVPAGGYASPIEVYGNGTDIFPTFSPAALPIDVAPTPNTIVQRDNLGYGYFTSPSVGDSTTRAATTAMVQAVAAAVYAAAQAVDLGGTAQAWQDVTASRANGTPYTNSTGRPIQVRVVASIPAGGFFNVTVGGVSLSGPAVAGSAQVQVADNFIVPNGMAYVVSWGGLASLNWFELR